MTDTATTDTATKVAQALLSIGAVGFRPRQPVLFKSGIKSPVYVDNRRLIFHPVAWHTVIDGFRELTTSHRLVFDTVAGVETAGIPHSAALAYTLNMPSVFVRKTPKDHGLGSRIEGGNVQGRTVLLIEDMVTTGGSSLNAVEALRGDGATVQDCLAITSYELKEADFGFTGREVRLHVLCPFRAIFDAALDQGLLNEAEATIVTDWHRDPYGWTERLDDTR